jgi:hypothetical protein
LRLWLILLILISIIGCSTKFSDASSHRYFADLIGKNLTLLRAQKLCERRDNDNYRALNNVGIIEPNEYCDLKVIANLPIGTKLTIREVKEKWVPMAGSSWYAIGEISFNNKVHEFEYLYGIFQIRRAPWESSEVPLKRPLPDKT